MQQLTPILLFAVAIATALNALIRRFNKPTVVGYIVTGGSMRQLVEWVRAS